MPPIRIMNWSIRNLSAKLLEIADGAMAAIPAQVITDAQADVVTIVEVRGPKPEYYGHVLQPDAIVHDAGAGQRSVLGQRGDSDIQCPGSGGHLHLRAFGAGTATPAAAFST